MPNNRLKGDVAITVAASQSNVNMQVVAGRADDIVRGLVIYPAATTAVGTVTLIDGGTSYAVPSPGTLSDQKPIVVTFGSHGIRSRNGGWKVTTGSGVSVLVIGDFS